MSAKAASTTLVSAASISATLRVIAVVCANVLPGTVSIFTWLKSVLVTGWNVIGNVANEMIVAMKASAPKPTVHMRWSRKIAVKRRHPPRARWAIALRSSSDQRSTLI